MTNRSIIFLVCVILAFTGVINIVMVDAFPAFSKIPIQWPITMNETGNNASTQSSSIQGR